MNSAFEWELHEDGGVDRLMLSGELLEGSDFEPILARVARGDKLRVDLGEIRRINSGGTRRWLKFVVVFESGGGSLILERCSPNIVIQLNTVANFWGKNGEVHSVLGPYYCSSCDAEHLHLIDTTGDDALDLEAAVACPECKADMEFDDLPESFLEFRTTG